MSEKIARYIHDHEGGLIDADDADEGEWVKVDDLLSGRVLEHEGKRYKLLSMEDAEAESRREIASYNEPVTMEQIHNRLDSFRMRSHFQFDFGVLRIMIGRLFYQSREQALGEAAIACDKIRERYEYETHLEHSDGMLRGAQACTAAIRAMIGAGK